MASSPRVNGYLVHDVPDGHVLYEGDGDVGGLEPLLGLLTALGEEHAELFPRVCSQCQR